MWLKKYYERVWQKLFGQSVMYLCMLAFLTVIIFCIIGMAIGYTYVKNNTDKIIEDFNYELLREKIRYTDERVGSIMSCAINISNLENFDEVINLNQNLDINQRYQVIDFCRDMENLTTNGVEHTLRFIYLAKSDLFIGKGGITTGKEYFDSFIRGKDYNYWKENILETDGAMVYDPESEQVYFKMMADSGVYIFLTASKNELIGTRENNNLSNSIDNDFIICDISNKQIFSESDKDYNSLLEKLDFSFDTKKTIIGNLAVSYQSVMGYDWKYTAVSDLRLSVSALTKARNVMVICVIIGIFLSVVIGYIFARKNHNDIHEIYDEVGVAGNPKNKNEYSYIKESISRLIEQNSSKDRLLYNRNKKLRTKLLKGLIVGDDSYSDVKKDLASCGVSADSRYVILAEVSIYDCEYLFFEQNQDTGESYSLSKLVIGNVYQDIFNDSVEMHTVENGKNQIFLIFIYDDDNSVNIRKQIEKGIQLIRDKFNILFKVYLSEEHETEQGFLECYKDIMRVREYQTSEDNWIIDAADEDRNKENISLYSYYLPMDSERMIIKSIKLGNIDDAIGNITHVFEININKGTPFRLMRVLSMNIANVIVKNASINNKHIEQFYSEFSDFFDHISNAASIEQMGEELEKFASFVCSLVERYENSSRHAIIDEIKQYVRENYSDQNLCVNQIAEQFKLKTSLLSSLFKQHEGVGLLEYITHVRVEETRKLIESTDKPLSTIWTETGFSSERTFYRVFEKHTGKKPSEFRKK